MNQYSKDTREAEQRETSLHWPRWTKVFFNHRHNTSLFTRWRLPRQVEKWKTVAVGERQEAKDRMLGRMYSSAEVRKTLSVFGVNEAVRQDRGGNRRQDGIELWSSALSRAYPITLPLSWVKMPWFPTLHPSLTLASPPVYCYAGS